MSTYNFTVVIEPDEEGFHAFVPALPGCHIESLREDGEPVPTEPEPFFVVRLSVPAAA
jgi:predicted RNase H-like HicB family nuclease